MTREEIHALSDRELGQQYYWVLDVDPDMVNEETRLIVAEFHDRGVTFEQAGEPFDDMDFVDEFELDEPTPH